MEDSLCLTIRDGQSVLDSKPSRSFRIKLWIDDQDTGEVLEEIGACITDDPVQVVQRYKEAWIEKGHSAAGHWEIIDFLRLTWQDFHPVFEKDGWKLGRNLSLTFGHCSIDDIDFPLVIYNIWMYPHECSIKKTVYTGWYVSRWVSGENPDDAILFSEHDPMILEMAHRINLAIHHGDTLDLSAYMDSWREKEKDFGFGVSDDNAASVPFHKCQTIPNDYGIFFWQYP